jgi:peptide/nickel transport system substrate-binding protein
MKSRRWFVLLGCLLAVALLAVLVAGCEEDTTTSGSEAGAATTAAGPIPVSVLECPQGPPSGETPQYGGTLVVLHRQVPSNIGAFWGTTGFADVQHCRYALENLVGLDEQGNSVPQLATSWDIDEAAKTITFHLREGVKFHDGTDFNAEAAKWNFEMWRDKRKTTKHDLDAVTAVDVVDPYTLRLTFSEYQPLFLQSLSSSSSGKMVSPTAYEEMGEKAFALHPVGTGPFEFESYEPDVSLKFKKFEGYWQEGLPYLDGVEIRFVADPVVALTSFKSGEAHALYDVSATAAQELAAAGNTIDSRVQAIWAISGDTTSPECPFSKQEVREGIAYALDMPTIVDGVYGGFMPVTNQLALEGMMAYNPDIVGYPYDVEKARQLLSANGITPETPWNTTLSYVTGQSEDELFTVMQEYLAEVGINITLNGLAFPSFKQKNSQGFKNELIVLGLSYNPLEMRYSTTLTANLSEDATAFVDIATPEEFNAVYRDMLVETDPAEIERMYQEMNKIAVDDFCLCAPFMGKYGLIAKSPKVHDYGFCSVVTAEFLPERAWLSE